MLSPERPVDGVGGLWAAVWVTHPEGGGHMPASNHRLALFGQFASVAHESGDHLAALDLAIGKRGPERNGIAPVVGTPASHR